MSKVVHFEIPVDDVERATAFYQDVLGWQITAYGDQRYWLVRAGEDEDMGANGALVDRGPLHSSPVVIAAVADIDDALKRAEQAGGEIAQGKLPVPTMGWSAYVRDPEGNTIGFFQMDPNAGVEGL